MITPHGGTLINLMSSIPENEEKQILSITLNKRETSDFELLANGAFSPLTGFMTRNNYFSTLNDMRLVNGLIWTIPITISITDTQYIKLKKEDEVYLRSSSNELLGKIRIIEIFKYDKELEAKKVYLTTDEKHPGVARLYSQGDYYIGGEVEAYVLPTHSRFNNYRHTPAELRKLFEERDWKRVVGFQTRNPIHRAHEYITKCALELVDGLLLHPLMGETKGDDIPAEIRMKCYEAILGNYYPHRRTVLSVFPAYMRYAGPKEAVFHAIVRKNYGCTHFIVGRDHAGIGSYYGTYDAQKIFENFTRDELGIEPMFFEHAFYCRRTDLMATTKTSRAMDHEKIFFSGSKVREILKGGGRLPPEFTRPEVEEILRRYYRNEK